MVPVALLFMIFVVVVLIGIPPKPHLIEIDTIFNISSKILGVVFGAGCKLCFLAFLKNNHGFVGSRASDFFLYIKGYALCRRSLLAFAIWRPWCLLFDILGAILVPREHIEWPFWRFGSTLGGHSGTSEPPWRTMKAAGWTRSVPEQDFHRFWGNSGTC